MEPITIQISKLHQALQSNILRGRDLEQSVGECKTLEDCRHMNKMIIKRIRELESRLKDPTGYKYPDKKEETMFLLDVTKKNTSDQIKYSRNMYMINPNKDQPSKTSDADEYWMLEPGTNYAIPKHVYAQRDLYKIYPHMYQQSQILKQIQENEDSNRPTCDDGGRYPIPQYYKLQFLDDENKKNEIGIDYDMRIMPKPVPGANHRESFSSTVDKTNMMQQRLKLKEIEHMHRIAIQQQQQISQENKRLPKRQSFGSNYNKDKEWGENIILGPSR